MDISTLNGKTFSKITVDYDTIIFENKNEAYKLYHPQDCCEIVEIEDIDGDIQRLVGQEIIDASERYEEGDDDEDGGTWSFYVIRTNLDSVTIRFYGSSNGWYSEVAELDSCSPWNNEDY